MHKQQKPLIRMLQHLSCTGGTLISRHIAGMPDVALLSEVNPLSRIHTEHPRFSPTDMTYLAVMGDFPQTEELSKKIFLADIKVITQHLAPYNKRLVIRDHSHSDYLVGGITPGPGATRSCLQEDYEINTVLSIRHPVDSYLSMLLRGWVKFTPASFDEFCRRYLLFIECNTPHTLVKYESFVADPEKEMKRICRALSLAYNEGFLKKINLLELTGNSGRGSDNKIAPRKRREFDDAFAKEVAESTHFREICAKFDYSPDLGIQP